MSTINSPTLTPNLSGTLDLKSKTDINDKFFFEISSDILSNCDKDDRGNTTYCQFFFDAIITAVSRLKVDPYDGHKRARADEEPLTLTKANTIYWALDILLQSIQDYTASEISG
jgi:hypothetical protein